MKTIIAVFVFLFATLGTLHAQSDRCILVLPDMTSPICPGMHSTALPETVAIEGGAVPSGQYRRSILSGFQMFTQTSYGLGTFDFGGGVGYEHAFGRLELDGYAAYLHGFKTGQSLAVSVLTTKVRTIGWVKNNFGLYGDLRYDPDWTADYHKNQWEYSGGVVFHLPRQQVRIYAGYLSQFANGIDVHGIETSQLKGFEVSPEIEMGSIAGRMPVRVGFVYNMLHGYQQGNPACDGSRGVTLPGCQRQGFYGWNVAGRVTFELGRTVGGFAR